MEEAVAFMENLVNTMGYPVQSADDLLESSAETCDSDSVKSESEGSDYEDEMEKQVMFSTASILRVIIVPQSLLDSTLWLITQANPSQHRPAKHTRPTSPRLHCPESV